jgi:hypothetical protein
MLHKILNYFFAFVWIANGLYCKVLNQVPRHQEIVASILGEKHAHTFTLLIGISEIIMALWILSRFKAKLNAITQISVIACMNILEFILVPDLLLWGKFNSLFAFILILFIYLNEFHWSKNKM